jgi:hypothetical protein
MYGEIDDYVERSLKNWIARHQPPVDGRQHLLQAAAKATFQQRSIISRLFSLLFNPSDPFDRTIYPQSEWEMGPASISIVSTLHFASSWRLVH